MARRGPVGGDAPPGAAGRARVISASSRPGPGRGRSRSPARRPRRARTPRSRSRRPTAGCRRPRAGCRRGRGPTAAAAGCAPSTPRCRRAPLVPPGTSSVHPPDLFCVHGAPEGQGGGPGAGAVLIVPARVPRGETLSPVGCPVRLLGPGLSSAPWARPSGASPPRMWFKKFWVEVLHLRHHTCGSWGPGPFAQVRCPPGLLARCGRSASFLLSTRGQLDRRAQRPLVRPPPLPWLPPVRPHAVCTAAGPCVRSSWHSAHRIGGNRRSAARVRGAGVPSAAVPDVGPSPDRHRARISPTCAHSWGQLLDESTGSPVDDELRRVGTGLPLSTGLHTTVDSDMSTWSRRQADDLVGRAQPDAPQAIDRWRGSRPPSTARVATEAGPEGPRGSDPGPRSRPLSGRRRHAVPQGEPLCADGGRRGGPGGSRGERRDGLSAAGERHVAAVSVRRTTECHCRARLLMRAVSSVTWV